MQQCKKHPSRSSGSSIVPALESPVANCAANHQRHHRHRHRH